MESCIKQLNERLQQHQLSALENDFKAFNAQQQSAVLEHLYLSASRVEVKYSFLQNVATRLLGQQVLPEPLIYNIKNVEALSFFTPGLKLNNNFSVQNKQSDNVLHSVFSQCTDSNLPFNYVRSLMLFESNENLLAALAQLNHQNLSPVGSFIAHHRYIAMPAKHEFSALLALMEAEQKQTDAGKPALINALKTRADCNEVSLLLASAYLQQATEQVSRLIR